jgi:MFS family permease
MYLAYKYAKKKQAERRAAREASGGSATSPDGASPPETRPESQAELTSIDGPNTTSSKPAKLPKEKHVETAEEKAAKKARRSYRWKILLGTCLPFALQALDMTVVASALPFIAEAFSEDPLSLISSFQPLTILTLLLSHASPTSSCSTLFLPRRTCNATICHHPTTQANMPTDSVNELNWIISSYNLTSAAFLPFWAQTTDIFGRHAALQSALILMLIGSALCTGAPTYAYGVLLLGRALQGIASAGIMISVRTILADKGSLRDYSINWTLFSLLNAVTFSVGPVIGGYLTQTSWRWCFAINLPVGVAAMVVAFLILRKELLGPQPIPELGEHSHLDVQTHRGRLLARLGTVDYGGQFLFLWGLGLMILAFTWAGGSYAWGSANVLAPLVIGAVLAVAWVLYEYSMAPPHALSRLFARQRAMIRWELLVQKDVGLLLYINFCVGAAMFAVMYFMDLYFAVVLGQSASKSGTNLLYFLPGLGGKSLPLRPPFTGAR